MLVWLCLQPRRRAALWRAHAWVAPLSALALQSPAKGPVLGHSRLSQNDSNSTVMWKQPAAKVVLDTGWQPGLEGHMRSQVGTGVSGR